MKLNIDENKKFLLIVGIALGMLFLLLGYDSSIRQNAQAMAKDNGKSIEDLEDTMHKFLGNEGMAEKRNEILKKEFLPDMKAKLEFPDSLPPAPVDLNPAVYLRQELMRMQRDAKNSATRKSISIPERDWDIGKKIRKTITPQEVAELRIRLSATSAVINKCIECNIKRVSKIQHKKATIEVVENTPTVVRRLPFSFEFEGDLSSVAGVMLSLRTRQAEGGQKETNFLQVRGCEITDSSRPGVLVAKLYLATLRVLDRSNVKEETGEQPPEQKTPDSTPGRRGSRRQRY